MVSLIVKKDADLSAGCMNCFKFLLFELNGLFLLPSDSPGPYISQGKYNSIRVILANLITSKKAIYLLNKNSEIKRIKTKIR